MLSYLAGRPQLPNGITVASLRDTSAFLRLSLRSIGSALRGLADDGVIVVSQTTGTRPAGILIRDPKEWGPAVPWRVDRREAMIALDAFFALQVETQSAASARAWDRAQSLLARGARTARYEPLARGARPARYATLSARGQARALERPLSTDSSRQRVSRSELEGGREGAELSEREVKIVSAFMAGSGVEEVAGQWLRRLKRLAAESNGELERLCRLAADPAGPALGVERLAQLERAMVSPGGSERIPYMRSEEQRLEAHVEACRRAGFEDEASEAEQQLAMLRSCESGSGQSGLTS